MSLRPLILFFPLALAGLAQPRMPDLAAQRDAMKKLEFMAGKWSGEARVLRGPGEPLLLHQTEDIQYKMDGLLLLVEGTGRNQSDGKVVFRALATIAYDDTAGVYRIRSHSDGRYTEAELKLAEGAKGFDWGFTAGPAKISYVGRINEKGEWTEVGEMKLGEQPPRKFIEMTVRPQK
jgi:hypothetical protein